MKTTIDLPADLVTDLKIRAAQDRRTMKEVTAEALRSWLNARKESKALVTSSEPTLKPEEVKRLEAFRAYRSHLKKNPPSEKRLVSLTEYLQEHREDRQTFGGRELTK
jgi:plasmid stability protein